MTTTTAQYRDLARQAEKVLDWTHAAYCWSCAIEGYPAAMSKGALAQRDLANLARKRDGARRMAEAETAAPIDATDFNYVGSPDHY